MGVAYCINESVYSGRLSHGTQYEILEEGENNIRIVGDNGKRRWFPRYCFSTLAVDVVVTVDINIEIDNYIITPQTMIDVTLRLSNGQRRWCFFATPASFNDGGRADIAGERLIMYGAPNMIIVSSINKDVIEQTIGYLERRNELLNCTSLIVSNAAE